SILSGGKSRVISRWWFPAPRSRHRLGVGQAWSERDPRLAQMQGGDQSEFGSTWYSRVTPLPPARAELKFEIDVDVCVIGGRLAGPATSRAARRGGGRPAPRRAI